MIDGIWTEQIVSTSPDRFFYCVLVSRPASNCERLDLNKLVIVIDDEAPLARAPSLAV